MALDLERLLRYPANAEEWLTTLLVGGILTLLSPLVVPAIFLLGYLLRVVRAGMVEAEEPPAFGDWETLFREGVVAFVVVFGYQLLPLVVATATLGTAAFALLTGLDVGLAVGLVGLAGGLTIAALLAVAFGYLTPIGLANYAREGEFRAAFDRDVIGAVAVDGAYVVPWLYGVGILLAANVVATLLGIVPFVGVFVVFYAQVAAAWVWGKGYADAMGTDGSTAGPDTTPA